MPKLPSLDATSTRQLVNDLSAAAAADVKEVTTAIQSVEALANAGERRDAVRRSLARTKPAVDFARCARALLSTSGEADLSSFNASCDSPAVLDATASCAVLFGRLVARRFAAAKAAALAKAVERGAPQSEIALAAEACVAALVSKRVTLERSPSAVSVDPRYLVFELTASVVLRDQQLELVRTFRPVHK